MTRSRWRAASCWLLASATLAGAHSFEPALLDLHERDAGVFDVVWKSPAAATTAAPYGAIAPRFPAACRVERDAEAADGDVESLAGTPQRLRLDCRPAGLRGLGIGIDGIAGTRVDAIIRIAWRDGSAVSGISRAGEETFVVPGVASGVPVAEVAWRYGRLGVTHVLSGADHLLFVLGLLLLVEQTGALLRTVTAFTLAHSLTLAGAVLGLVHVPPAPVEAAIALSVVWLAAELARPVSSATLARREPWVVGLVFGLLHGFGFAGALARVGLPADQVPPALGAFNAGVELGQLAFVLAMVVPVALWRRTASRPLWRLAPAYAIGTIAMAWTIERVLAFVG